MANLLPYMLLATLVSVCLLAADSPLPQLLTVVTLLTLVVMALVSPFVTMVAAQLVVAALALVVTAYADPCSSYAVEGPAARCRRLGSRLSWQDRFR